MRIIGGTRRGTRLAEVGTGDPAAHLRPTSDRVREAIFNLLTNSLHLDLAGLRVLDLFAGTGALGLEAISRGAAHVTFADNGPAALALLRRNIDILRAAKTAAVLRLDATRLGRNPGGPFDLVFLDPPYGRGMGEAALASALAGGWLAAGAVVVWEECAPPPVPAQVTPIDQRRYGDTWITILRAG